MTNPQRIGNDILVTLEIMHDDSAACLDDKKLRLYLVNKSGRIPVTDFAREGNIVSFVYKGTEQTVLGDYYVTVIENYGEDGKNQGAGDSMDIFTLVPRSQMINRHDCCGNSAASVRVKVNVSKTAVIYESVIGKPTLNGVEISGHKTARDYGLATAGAGTGAGGMVTSNDIEDDTITLDKISQEAFATLDDIINYI